MMMLQFGPLSQVKRTRKMIHLIHNTEVTDSLGCVFQQLFISQFAVVIKNNCNCCHSTKFTQVSTQLIDSNLNTMLFLSFGQTDQGKQCKPRPECP